MKKKKILIIGKKSFIGTCLFYSLKKKFNIKKTNLFSAIKEIRKKHKYDYIINCTINKNYINNKYNKKYDFDLKIASNIKSTLTKYVFLSSRKIYKSKSNIFENQKANPNTNYGKNKFITEIKLLQILKKRLVTLRISNLIGLRISNNKRKMHNNFMDIFITQLLNHNRLIKNNKKSFKDFITINQLCTIIEKIIKLDIYGTYNASLGKKIYLTELTRWLISASNNVNIPYTTVKKIKKYRSFNEESFTLNSKKIQKKINYKIKKSDVKKECLKLSKIICFNKNKIWR